MALSEDMLTSLSQVFKNSFKDLQISTLLEFNTARWNETVSGLPWPGPEKDNRSEYDNFTCYFKVKDNKADFNCVNPNYLFVLVVAVFYLIDLK